MTDQKRYQRLLLTGAAGGLGKVLRQGLKPYADALRASDRAPMEAPGPHEEVVQCDLADRAAVMRLVDGVDGIVHFGGISVESAFDSILKSNILGTYNIYEAARR